MNLSHSKCFFALMVCFAASCQTEPGGDAPIPSEAPAAEKHSVASAPATRTSQPAATTAPSRATAAGLTLEAAIRIALERNPDLSVIRKSEGVQSAALEVARAFPYNPLVQTDVRPYSREQGGKQGDVFVEAAILQEIELAGRGRHRERTGVAELRKAQWSIREKEVFVIAETERRFFGAVYWRERRELDESLTQLKGELLGITQRRFDAGLSTASDVALARIEAQSTLQQLELTRLREDAAFAELRKHLGLEPGAPLDPVGSLSRFEWIQLRRPEAAGSDAAEKSALAEDVQALVGTRPDVKAGEAQRDAADARADLASAERVPNMTLGPVYEHDEAGTSFLGLKVELPIPILSTGGPAVRQRQAELEESIESLKQLRLKARTELDTAFARYERAHRLVARFRGDLMEGLERDIQRVMSQYDAGVASLLEAYAARDKMMQARQNGLDARYELALSAADLTEAAALPPEALLKPFVPLEEPKKP